MSRAALFGVLLAAGLSTGVAQSRPVPNRPLIRLLGRSEQGRPMFVIRVGDRDGPRVLVFGAIDGNEPAGIAVAYALEHASTTDDVWIVPDLNPDGIAAGTRQDSRGVSLNSNWSSEWQQGGSPWDVYYGGPYPFSERETRLARNLILRIHPLLTIWYHQHMDVVWAYGPSTHAGQLYSRISGLPFYYQHWLPGTATNWQNHHLPHTSSLTIELPAGSLSPQQVRRQVRAVLITAHLLGLKRHRRGHRC